MSLSVKELLKIGKNQLEQAGVEDAAIDCKLLYCHMTKVSSSQLILQYQKILQDSLCEEYFRLLDKRASGVPLQYIIGTQEFMGFEFLVNENVLIPRQDTETLVEKAIEIIRENNIKEVLDLCTGSGAIGISLCKICPELKVTCSDISEKALSVAKLNRDQLGCKNKIKFAKGDLLEPFKGKMKNKKFDMIISNPPYIRSDVIPTLQREVKDHEPMMALDGGEDGLDFYKRIINDSSKNLKKGGVLIFEIGHDQKDVIVDIIEETEMFENIIAYKDLAGRDRIVKANLIGKKK